MMDKIINRFAVFWIAIFLSLLFIVWLFHEELAPFLVGLILAYIVRPIALKLYHLGFNRSLVSIVLTLFIFVFMILIFALGIPLLVSEIARFVSGLGEFFDILRIWSEGFVQFFDVVSERLDIDVISMAKENFTEALRFLVAYLLEIVSGISNFLSILVTIFLTPVACFYFLRDWDRAFNSLRDLLPLRYRDNVLGFFFRVDLNLSGFIRGQLGVCTILACYYGFLLTLIGVKFGVLLGLLIGLLSILPYIGFFVGFSITLLLSFMQFFYPLGIEGVFIPLTLVIIVFIFGQLFESFWLSPVLIGDKVDLHPLWIIFALIAGGGLGGFFGVLLAIPVTIVIREAIFLLLSFYRGSVFYGKG